MKFAGMSICLLACSVCVTLPCVAQANPWNGSWKIDPATMKYNGPTFSITTDAEGYVITRQGKAGPKTICDGKPHKSSTDNSMVTCSKQGSGYAIEETENGKRTARITTSVSSDGKTMTRKAVIYPTDGSSSYTVTGESRRVSGGPGANGEWKEVKFNESQDRGILSIEVKGDTVAFKETDGDKPIMCKLDGTPTKFPMGGSMSVKADGSHTLKVTYRGDDGKVRRDNTFMLSPDGKTVTETDVTPNPSPSTMSMKFHKM